MIELGTTERTFHVPKAVKEDSGIQIFDGEPDKGFLEINFIINEKILRTNVDEMLMMETTPLRDVSDDEIDQQLERLNVWRHTFVAAAEEIAQNKEIAEREFKRWHGLIRPEVIRSILESRTKLLEDFPKMTKSWLGSITKEEIESVIVSNDKWSGQYVIQHNNITDLNKKERLLKDLVENMKSRAFTLRYIGEKRLELRRE